jgi:hypothetical protein
LGEFRAKRPAIKVMLRLFKNFGSAKFMFEPSEVVPGGSVSGVLSLNLLEALTVEKLEVCITTDEQVTKLPKDKNSYTRSKYSEGTAFQLPTFNNRYISKGHDVFKFEMPLPEKLFEPFSYSDSHYKAYSNSYLEARFFTNKGPLYYSDVMNFNVKPTALVMPDLRHLQVGPPGKHIEISVSFTPPQLRVGEECKLQAQIGFAGSSDTQSSVQFALKQTFMPSVMFATDSTSIKTIGSFEVPKSRSVEFAFTPKADFMSHAGELLSNKVSLEVQLYKRQLILSRYETQLSIPLNVQAAKLSTDRIELRERKLAKTNAFKKLKDILMMVLSLIQSKK